MDGNLPIMPAIEFNRYYRFAEMTELLHAFASRRERATKGRTFGS
jgi:hypothetical protein